MTIRGPEPGRLRASRVASGTFAPALHGVSIEALNVVTQLDYTYRANVAEGICMLVRFGRTVSSMLCTSADTMLKMTPGASWTRTRVRVWAAGTLRAWRSRLQQ